MAAERPTPSAPANVYAISVATGEKRQLTSAPPNSFGDVYPALSPDGSTLAFVRRTRYTAADIYLSLADGGEPSRLTSRDSAIFGIAWAADGKRIIYSGAESRKDPELYQVSVPQGATRHLSNAGAGAYYPAISHQGDRLAYEFVSTTLFRVREPPAFSKNMRGPW